MAMVQLPKWTFANDPSENFENFKLFKRAWENFGKLTFKETTTEDKKIAYLECAIAQDTEANKFYNRIDFTDDQKKLSKELILAIESKVKPSTTKRYERIIFRSIKQEENDSIEDFINKLKLSGKNCDFAEREKEEIIDQFIMGLRDPVLQKSLIKRADIDLDTVVNECKLEEMINKRVENLKIKSEPEETVNRIKSFIECKFCGRKHEKIKEKCPAWGKPCNNCKKPNHFAVMCKSRNANAITKTNKKRYNNKRTVNTLEEESDSDEEEEFIQSIEMWEDVNTVRKKKKGLRCNVDVAKHDGSYKLVEMILDTGATCCLMGLENLKEIFKTPKITAGKTKLNGVAEISVYSVGFTLLKIKSHKCTKKFVFQIVEGRQTPLLSDVASQVLGFITVHNVNILNDYPDGKRELNKIIRNHAQIFVGDGRMKAEVSLETDESYTPVQEKPRRIPVSIRTRLEQEIADLCKRNLIEKVEHPVKWTSNIVIVKKKDKDQIRICLDPRYLNEALVRKKYQMPTIEEVLPELSEAKVFSLLDCKNGFLQVPLQKKSRDLTAFWTPLGIFRWKVLPFGISTAPEIFQQRQCEIIQGLKGVEVIADDILVYGVGKDLNAALTDHNIKLEKLLVRLEKNGVKLNKSKAKFAKTSLKFYGLELSDKGVYPDKDKTAAIELAKNPESLKELECFLGMVTYHQRFIKNLSTLTEPLRNLLRTKQFEWNEEHRRAFENLKKAIANIPRLKYYNLNKSVVLQTDASRNGLGGVLLQDNEPVIFVSKSLTTTEKKYAIIELELLAILFTCKRLNQYLCGQSNITMETDHLPLRGIFNKPIHLCSKRIQRMRLELLKYDIKIRYKPGKDNKTADFLSRSPVGMPKSDFEEEEAVLSVLSKIEKIKITKNDIIEDKNVKEIREHILITERYRKLMEVIETREWEKMPQELNIYKTYKNELCVQNGLIMKGDRFVIPSSLRKKYLNFIHIGHPGTEAALSKARQSIFWPGINNDIIQITKNCETCSCFRPAQQKQKMMSHEIPTYPFEIVSMDFCEAEYDGKKRNILVVVDHYSDYIEFVFMKNTASKDVIIALKMIFARQGTPREVLSDGAHNLASKEMREFANEWNFELRQSSPYYPKGNGKAEAAVKVIKNIIKKTQKQGECLFEAMLEQRNTRNSIGYSPAQRLLGRSLKSRMPTVKTNLTTKATHDVREKISKHRAESKKYYDRNARDLKPLEVGEQIRVKLRPDAKIWSCGTISKQLDHRKYEIIVNGKTYVRNRQYITKKFNNQPANLNKPTNTSYDVLNEPTIVDRQPNQQEENIAPEHQQLMDQSLEEEEDFRGFPNSTTSVITRAGRLTKRPTYMNDFVQ